MTPVQVCSICGGPIVGFGNNAQPVNDGLCCDRCNERVVLPALLERIATPSTSARATAATFDAALISAALNARAPRRGLYFAGGHRSFGSLFGMSLCDLPTLDRGCIAEPHISLETRRFMTRRPAACARAAARGPRAATQPPCRRAV